MADITNLSASKNAATKPRFSLLSSKRSITITPEDQTKDQLTDPNPITDHVNLENGFEVPVTQSQMANPKTDDGDGKEKNLNKSGETHRIENVCETNGGMDANISFKSDLGLDYNGQVEEKTGIDRVGVSKENLIRLLSMLKNELQSKEMALASIKLEQLKRLMNPVEISRSNLASTYMKLQDRLKRNEQKSNNNHKPGQGYDATQESSALVEVRETTAEESKNLEKFVDNNSREGDDDDALEFENVTILNSLLELLDRHPLLALPRDSIYCLDYNCNELSTKNYLNLKIQQLENLIDQHRRFRYFMGERLKRSEQRYIDLTLKVEHENNLRMRNERSAYENGGRSALLNEIDHLKESLEKEKASKHAIVMTLLNELLDERERNEILSRKLIELASRQSDDDKKIKPNLQQQQSTPAPSGQHQTICKPRVPAKPAQLLDRQLSQARNK